MTEDEKKLLLASPGGVDFNATMRTPPKFGADVINLAQGIANLGNAGQARINNVYGVNSGDVNPNIAKGNGLLPFSSFATPQNPAVEVPLDNTLNNVNSNLNTTTSAPSVYDQVESARARAFNGSGYTPRTGVINNLNPVTPETQQLQSQLFRDSLAIPNRDSSVQQLYNNQVTTKTFQDNPLFRDAYGNNLQTSKVFDNRGKEMSRADEEQASNMFLARELARSAAKPDTRQPEQVVTGHDKLGQAIYATVNPFGDSSGQSAEKALSVFGGLKAASTISDTLKDVAATNHLNIQSNLASNLEGSNIAFKQAEANQANALAAKYNMDNEQTSMLTKYFKQNPKLMQNIFNPERSRNANDLRGYLR